VEDLCAIGKDSKVCPYYLARSKLPQSDIIIAPYSYILDPELRKTLQLDLKNSIIVFDEAHNIDAQCEEIMSFELSADTLVVAL
jgi:Rad3-related DNA helicase